MTNKYEQIMDQYRALAKDIGAEGELDSARIIKSLLETELEHISVLGNLDPEERYILGEHQRLCQQAYRDRVDTAWLER